VGRVENAGAESDSVEWGLFVCFSSLINGNAKFALQFTVSSTIYIVFQEKRSIFWEVIVSVILSKNCICTCVLFRTVSEIEPFHCTVHCTLYRRATRHVLTRVAECIDVDGGIFENVLY
jgi:hypothetical protein